MCLNHRDTFTNSDEGGFERAEYTVISSLEAWYLRRQLGDISQSQIKTALHAAREQLTL